MYAGYGFHILLILILCFKLPKKIFLISTLMFRSFGDMIKAALFLYNRFHMFSFLGLADE